MSQVLASHSRPLENNNIVRKSVDYHPSVWGDYFINNTPSCFKQKSEAWMKQRANELKDEVRKLFHDTSDDLLQTMNIVDAVQLLGVSYHFEQEISDALNRVNDANNVSNFNLHEVALRFRLLRQHGYYVPSDIFNEFIDDKGNFKATLKDDPRGLLSLYNAAYLGIHGETVLDNAISFTRTQLTSIVRQLQEPLRMQVSLDLKAPLWRRMKRLLVREYISIYEEEEDTEYATILELAKLDFNLLQFLHWEELKNISIWYKEFHRDRRISYVRDRVAECYYWILGVYFEPHYSLGRHITTKVILLLSILDDTYDSYGTLEETCQLTQAIQRWDRKAVDEVPDYLKDFFLKLIRTFEEFEDMLPPNEKFFVSYLKESMKDVARNFYEEAKWAAAKYKPTLDEHLRLSLLTTCYPTLTCASFVGMGNLVTREAFDWVISFPRMIKASTIICRIMDDVVSQELEQQREHVVSTLQCYMNDYQTNIEIACKKLLEMVEFAWRDINEEWISPNTLMPKALLERSINFSRMIDTLYKDIDAYTNSSIVTKDNITILLVQPILL